ncbi:hypothetical protein BDC45DRAFT_517900 [Circinella umbellata]|nr:hypothetical protein BDC45DRAFT_517900 [Circinella umbellata]
MLNDPYYTIIDFSLKMKNAFWLLNSSIFLSSLQKLLITTVVLKWFLLDLLNVSLQRVDTIVRIIEYYSSILCCPNILVLKLTCQEKKTNVVFDRVSLRRHVEGLCGE